VVCLAGIGNGSRQFRGIADLQDLSRPRGLVASRRSIPRVLAGRNAGGRVVICSVNGKRPLATVLVW
jgi:hypothetical protein